MTEEIITCQARTKLANNLKALRKLKGKNIKEVAEETGFVYSYILSLENPKYKKNPSMETIDKLASYYNVEISTLFL